MLVRFKYATFLTSSANAGGIKIPICFVLFFEFITLPSFDSILNINNILIIPRFTLKVNPLDEKISIKIEAGACAVPASICVLILSEYPESNIHTIDD